jgi:hypothetical protein
MTTRLYLPISGTPPLGSLAVNSNWELTNSLSRLPCYTTKQNTALTTYTYTWAAALTQQWCWRQYQSDTLKYAYDWTTADTVSMVIGKCGEAASGTDSQLAYVVRVVSGDGSTIRGVIGLFHATSSEFPLIASAATRIHAARTGGATNFSSQAGDRIIIEIGLHGVTPTLTNAQMRFGDPSATADFALTEGLTTDLVPWVELSRTVTFGAPPISINLNLATITVTGLAADIQPGVVTINLNAGMITISGLQASIDAPLPSITVNMDCGIISILGLQADIVTGAVTVGLDAGEITVSGLDADIQPGTVTIGLGVGVISVSGLQASIDAPLASTITINLDMATISVSGQSLDVQPGPVTVSLDCAALSITGQPLDVQPGAVSIGLNTGEISISGLPLDVQPGAVVLWLDLGEIAVSGLDAEIQPGGVTIGLDAGEIAVSGLDADIQPGTVTINLDAGIIAVNGLPASISIDYSITVNLDCAVLAVDGLDVDVIPGDVSVDLDCANMVLSGQTITVIADVWRKYDIINGRTVFNGRRIKLRKKLGK